jgi:hypothetical protein
MRKPTAVHVLQYMHRTTSGAAGNGLYTTTKYLRHTTSGAARIGLSNTTKYLLN